MRSTQYENSVYQNITSFRFLSLVALVFSSPFFTYFFPNVAFGAKPPTQCVFLLGSENSEVNAIVNLVKSRRLGVEVANFDLAVAKSQIEKVKNFLNELRDQEYRDYFRSFLQETEINDGGPESRQRLSQKNLRRLVKGRDLKKTLSFKLAWPLVAQLLKSFQHNTVDTVELSQDQTLWLSSKQLENLGLYPGLQHDPFNKDFLKTQNWIFFFVNNLSTAQDYGDKTIYLNRSAAEKNGMIFPFVMYHEELVEFMYLADLEISRKLELLFKFQYPKALQGAEEICKNENCGRTRAKLIAFAFHSIWRENVKPGEFLEKHWDLFNAGRNLLSQFAFTVNDYHELAAFAIASYVESLKFINPRSYLKTIYQLLKGQISTSYLTPLLEKSFEYENIPSNYELRIPVAIDPIDFRR